MTKRLRIFAGPNGSGKTTLINFFPKKIPLGIVVNADDIEKTLRENAKLDFTTYGIKANTKSLILHLQTGISKSKGVDLSEKNVTVKQNRLVFTQQAVNSYIAADIAAFIRMKLLEKGDSFSFETVLSHPSKMEFINLAKSKGFRIYLYFIATESSVINISRVANRVVKSGHDVDNKLIASRYRRTLKNLYDVVKLTNRAYLFDNSGEYSELICEVLEGYKVVMRDIDKQPPEWFKKYFYSKAVKS